MIHSYVALDIETTGLNPATDRIMEIGAAKVKNGEILSTYQILINPQTLISPQLVSLTGINNDMVAGKPVISEVIGELIEYTEDLPLLGHNIIFDFSFLKKAAVNNQMTFEKNGIDTLKIARRVLPELEHRRLEYLCRYFEINPEKNHRALDDALSAMKVFHKLYELSPEDKGFQETIHLNFSAKKDSMATPAQLSYLTGLLAYNHLVPEQEIKSLTKSQASRMIDRIISVHGKNTN